MSDEINHDTTHDARDGAAQTKGGQNGVSRRSFLANSASIGFSAALSALFLEPGAEAQPLRPVVPRSQRLTPSEALRQEYAKVNPEAAAQLRGWQAPAVIVRKLRPASHTWADTCREDMIGQAMESEEGRLVVCQAMIEPLALHVRQRSLLRRVLQAHSDLIPLPRDCRDLWTIPERDAQPVRTHLAPPHLPAIVYAINPCVQLYDFPRASMAHLVRSLMWDAQDGLTHQEDSALFRMLQRTCEHQGIGWHKPLPEAIRCMGDRPNVYVVAGHQYGEAITQMRGFRKTDDNPDSIGDLLGKPVYLATDDEVFGTPIPGIFVCGSPANMGMIQVEIDITGLPYNDPAGLRLGYTFYQEIASCVYADAPVRAAYI